MQHFLSELLSQFGGQFSFRRSQFLGAGRMREEICPFHNREKTPAAGGKLARMGTSACLAASETLAGICGDKLDGWVDEWTDGRWLDARLKFHFILGFGNMNSPMVNYFNSVTERLFMSVLSIKTGAPEHIYILIFCAFVIVFVLLISCFMLKVYFPVFVFFPAPFLCTHLCQVCLFPSLFVRLSAICVFVFQLLSPVTFLFALSFYTCSFNCRWDYPASSLD